MPVLGYHFPARSAPGIPIEQLAELPIAGLKDSSGNAERLIPELAAYEGPVWVGSSALLALAGTLGATGAILALANTDPELCISAFGGDLEAQRELIPAHLEIRTDPPHGLKRRLARTSGTSTAVRRALPVAR
jgi:dihydrodipicolinate synthase/N-acetylneuraminate lyase